MVRERCLPVNNYPRDRGLHDTREARKAQRDPVRTRDRLALVVFRRLPPIGKPIVLKKKKKRYRILLLRLLLNSRVRSHELHHLLPFFR